jgi:drug/metabolite transporter superfamily protein YnfA
LPSILSVPAIGGGWLIWKWLRDDRPTWWELLGGVILILYGIIPTLQASHFGRVYAVDDGFFIVLSLLWGWYFVDGKNGTFNVLQNGKMNVRSGCRGQDMNLHSLARTSSRD